MSDAIKQALESAIRTYESMSPGVMTVEHKQAIDALQALQSGEPVVDVNQQLVEALQAALDCGSTSDQWWIDKAREALLSAGKGEDE
jgi:dihydropteroate synthase